MNETKITQCIVPNLVAGEYKVKVNQNIQAEETKQKIKKEFTFGVDAARFTLNPNDIYSVYPPENTTGDYSNHLPHIVFNRKTLPWERTIDSLEPQYKREEKEPIDFPPIPWMALLLFTEEEMKTLKISQSSLKDIIIDGKTTDDVTKPKIYNKDENLKLMPWENEEQKCLTIDITKEQFKNAIPSLEGLPFLAHSKEVSISHKDLNGIEETNTKTETKAFTIVTEVTKENTKVTKENTEVTKENTEVTKEKITGEGFFSVLTGNRLIKPKTTYTAVLVSLEGHGEYIGKDIGTKNIRLVVLAHWNFNSFGTKTFKELLDKVQVKSMIVDKPSVHLKPYLEQGYIPLKHQMKNGAKNISWYRGPFVPNNVGFDSFLFETFTSADSALRYHYDTGLMDVSVAAAWELGKMLALQNKEFTKAIVDWNTNPIDNPNSNKEESYSKADVVDWLENNPLKTAAQKTGFVSFKPYPKVVVEFLKDLASLKGVPTSYLIPDQNYIANQKSDASNGALTLFYIDPLWIYALLEGAVSLLSKNNTQTKYNISNIILEVYYFKGKTGVMGFMLHSQLVSSWRGIEIKAYTENSTEPLDLPIRFERIFPDLFLGIFPSTISRIEVIQPYEGLHFGVKSKETNGEFLKLIKDKNGKTNVDSKIDITIKNEMLNLDILKISELVKAFKEKTNEDKFTSAQFAYQMIDSPLFATFNINLNKS